MKLGYRGPREQVGRARDVEDPYLGISLSTDVDVVDEENWV